ncbi:hypothetical protein EHS39_23760 [Ensifer sp. MPMI2T]|nr:hypothetical protein EHS39_23760 [Ensifer sp. MPMI2T]
MRKFVLALALLTLVLSSCTNPTGEISQSNTPATYDLMMVTMTHYECGGQLWGKEDQHIINYLYDEARKELGIDHNSVVERIRAEMPKWEKLMADKTNLPVFCAAGAAIEKEANQPALEAIEEAKRAAEREAQQHLEAEQDAINDAVSEAKRRAGQ